MAAEKEYKPSDEEEEPRIPVFTVLKNGAILKNIFIVNPIMGNQDQPQEEILIIGRHPDCNVMLTHPSISRFHLKIISNPSLQKLAVIDLSSVHGTWVSEKKIDPWERAELNEGDSLRIGGSSRVYRLHWIPLSKAYNVDTPYLSASDEPMEDDKEDETCLETYQDENSLPIGNEPIEEKEATIETPQEEEKEAGNSLFKENEEILVESMSPLYSESLGITVKKEIPSAPLIPESPVYSLFDGNEEGLDSRLQYSGEEKEIHCEGGIFQAESENISLSIEGVISDALVSVCDNDDQSLEPSLVTDVKLERGSPDIASGRTEKDSYNHLMDHCDYSFSEGRTENQTPLREDEATKESSMLVGELLSESKNEHSDREYQTADDIHAVHSLSHDKKPEDTQVERQPNLLVEFDSASSFEGTPASKRHDETEDQKVYSKEYHRRDVLFECYPPCAEESVISFFPATEVAPEIEDDKENQTPQSVFAGAELSDSETIANSAVRLDKTPNVGSIWSRRGKPASSVQLRTCKNRMETVMAGVDTEDEKDNQENSEDKLILKENFSCLNEEDQETFTPDKENFTPNTLLVNSLKKKGKRASVLQLRVGDEDESITKDSCLTEKEEEIFTPDKENFTPNTFLLKSLKKKGILEMKNSKPSRSSPLKATCSPPIMCREEDLVGSPEKESHVLSVLQETKPIKQPTTENQLKLEGDVLVDKRRQERVPFQSLVLGKTRPKPSANTPAKRSSSSVNHHPNNSVPQRKRAWTMVADITTLLNKESRKKLQLLRGLKGTHLVIPRMVIRELDCLRRRGSLFGRKTEASQVLEWIEQCMVETTSWIHVQSSAEDVRLTAPTPPASPRSPIREGSGGFSYERPSSLPFGGLMEIVSPTTEDHILECALLCRKLKSDWQLVLLSDDITLKVKSMAEGLICETVHEFRESLINPFSERFLWADSSPRGQTWSVMDDVVLREKYNRYPMKRLLKGESAKGLKLILLHNSHYGQRTPIS